LGSQFFLVTGSS